MEILYQLGGDFALVVFDVTVREIHAASASASEHPVEKGVNIVDHIRPDGKRYSAEAMVTNTPIIALGNDGITNAEGSVRPVTLRAKTKRQTKGANRGSPAEYEDTERQVQANVLQFDSVFNKVQDTLDTLYYLIDNSVELTITTAVKEYESMFLLDISAPRDAGSTDSIVFSLEFHQVRFAVTASVAAPDPVQTRGKAKKNKGAQSTKEVSKPNISLAGKLVEKYNGINLRPGRNTGI